MTDRAAAAAEARADAGWRWRRVLQAPHRLGFLLAMVVLGAAGGWWSWVQLARLGVAFALPWLLPPPLVHAAVMVFGFMPLFFGGFLFTAGPRWLRVAPPPTRALLPPLLAQATGWLLWLAGAHLHRGMALAGLTLAAAGLAWMTWRFWRMLRASSEADRLHATLVCCALAAGSLCLAGTRLALMMEAPQVARAFVLSGLWTCVVAVFVTVANRMIPFFSAQASPARGGRDWLLPLMLAMVLFQAAAVWLEPVLGGNRAWLLLRGLLELAAGFWVLKLARTWALARSLKIRLLAMLHLGLVWLGLAWCLSGVSQLAAISGSALLPLAALHALTMGCLGTLMFAMVTRVSAGRSGRSDVADDFTWALFWLLQLAVLLRIAGAAGGPWLLLAAATLWTAVMLAWGLRLGSWFGRQAG